MPSFARELEQTLHNALGEASSRRHEYATLEHLLLALIEDVHAGRVMEACGVNTGELRDAVRHYLDTELETLKVSAETDPSPTSGSNSSSQVQDWQYRRKRPPTRCGRGVEQYL